MYAIRSYYAIGSTHALKTQEVALNYALLDEIRAAVSVPLVLHGASGVLDDSVQEGIRRGICKVNIATQLNKVLTIV